MVQPTGSSKSNPFLKLLQTCYYGSMEGSVELANTKPLTEGSMMSDAADDDDNFRNSNDHEHPTQWLDIEEAMERLGMGRFQYQILLAAGLCFAADAMEVLLLSFLGVVLQVEWDLTSRQMDTMISVVFLGAMLGTLVLGPLGDNLGRKPVFGVTASLIALFGFTTAFCTTYEWLLLTRFLVGFGVGGLTVPFDTLAEFVPTSERGTNLLYIEFFWTAGTLLVPVLAWLSLGNNTADDNDDNNGQQNDNDDGSQGGDWRLFVMLCAIPCVMSTVLGISLVPESPRWLLTTQKPRCQDKALKILRRAAKCNGLDPYKVFPLGTRLFLHEDTSMSDSEDMDSFSALISPTWWKTSLRLWAAWFGLAFLYYGVILVVSIVFSNYDSQEANNANDGYYEFDYQAIFISASAEVVGLILVLMTVDRWGRVPTQTVAYLMGGISCCMLAMTAYYVQQQELALQQQIEDQHNAVDDMAYEDDAQYEEIVEDPSVEYARSVLIVFAFLARMSMMGASCTTWVSTSEILTTEIRATGHAAANAVARLGGFFCPYIISESTSLPVMGGFILVVSILTASVSWYLPETAGKAMGLATAPPTVNVVEGEESSNSENLSVSEDKNNSTAGQGNKEATLQTMPEETGTYHVLT